MTARCLMPSLPTTRHATRRATAVACLALLYALPGQAAITSSGEVSPDPTGGSFTGFMSIGNAGAGAVTVNGGSQLAGQRLNAGLAATGSGLVTVAGAGSSFALSMDRLPGSNFLNTSIGSQGSGSLSVLNGGSFVNGLDNADCQANCRLYFSNGAGSQGTLLVNGSGSTLSTPGGVRVGYASLFTQPVSGFAYGTPGGASSGTATISGGGVATSSFLQVANVDEGSEAKGSESASGSVLIDGPGSAWNLVRNAAQTGSRALLSMGSGHDTTGTMNVRNGGLLRIDGSGASGQFTGISLAAPAATSTSANVNAALTVSGVGSKVEYVGGRGFFGIGRSAGADGQLTVSNGGVISGIGTETGLTYVDVGTGGIGRATVTGAGSLLQMNGRNSDTNTFAGTVLGGGAFLNVGRTETIAGNGTLVVSAAGKVVIDTTAVALTNTSGRTGFGVGWDAGSIGSLTVTGTGSAVQVLAGDGLTPYLAVGRDGGSGNLQILSGGKVEVSNSHVSVPNPGGYLNGDVTQLEIGRRTNTGTEATSGSVTVSGAGSQLTLGGMADSLIYVGRGNNTSGTLNVLNGGSVSTMLMRVGQDSGASGTVNFSGGALVIDGTRNGGDRAGQAGGLVLGRGGGVGTLNATNASTIVIGSTASTASLRIGGSSNSPGGSGTANVMGGSTVNVNSPNAQIMVGATGTAALTSIGALNITGVGSSVSALGSNSRVLIGAGSNTVGSALVGAGSALSAGSLIGVAHDGNANTGGIGSLIVNGTASGPLLVVGSAGLLGGSGVVNGNVVNHGVIAPGNSPGRLTIDGSLDNSAGKIVLEVQARAGGGYDHDELVLGNWTGSTLDHGAIEFLFLEDTDPTAFLASGAFTLGNFFKEIAGGGAIIDVSAAYLTQFMNVAFSASSAHYSIGAIRFGSGGVGSFTATAVPAPQTLALVLLGLGLMVGRRSKAAERAGLVLRTRP